MFNRKDDRPPKLVVSRRAIAAGFASIIATPVLGRGADDLGMKLRQIADVPMTFNPQDFTDMMRDGLFMPDYRFPMCRVLFSDGTATHWHRYTHVGKKTHHQGKDWSKLYAIETCVPDANGAPRYAQLKIG